MSDNKEPKVTECWALSDGGIPYIDFAYCPEDERVSKELIPAILLWREDYDALLKELEELRKYNQDREEYDAYKREKKQRERINRFWGLEEKWDGSKE